MEKYRNKTFIFNLGCILLVPAIISVFAFIVEIFGFSILGNFFNNYEIWIGDGGTSGFPFYVGLLAISGSYLITKSTINKE